MEHFIKYIFALLMAVLAVLEPTLKFAVILLFAILFDCLSAYDLNRRLKKIYPDKVSGKFESHYALKMLLTFIQAYSVVILLHWVDTIILNNFSYLNLSNIGAALFCAIQIWSILENASSANGARWAKVLQRVMVDKAKRHFDINLEDEKNNNGANAGSYFPDWMQDHEDTRTIEHRANGTNDRQREPPREADDLADSDTTGDS